MTKIGECIEILCIECKVIQQICLNRDFKLLSPSVLHTSKLSVAHYFQIKNAFQKEIKIQCELFY